MQLVCLSFCLQQQAWTLLKLLRRQSWLCHLERHELLNIGTSISEQGNVQLLQCTPKAMIGSSAPVKDSYKYHLDLCAASCTRRHVQATIKAVAAPKAQNWGSKRQVLLPRDAQRDHSGPQSAAQNRTHGSPSSAEFSIGD